MGDDRWDAGSPVGWHFGTPVGVEHRFWVQYVNSASFCPGGCQVSYPAENTRFVPLNPTNESSLISSADAFASIATSVAALGSDASGPVVESLVSYFNSGFGSRAADGSVTLTYQGTPVWLISAPLNPIVPRTVGGAGFSAPPTTPRSGCSEIWVVDAVSATTLTWWQQCPA